MFAAAVAVVAVLAYFMRDGGRWELAMMAISVIVISGVNAVWLQIRLAARLTRLADRARREELAVTLVAAEGHLRRQLGIPLARALAPVAVAYPLQVLAYIVFWRRFGSSEGLESICVFTGYVLACMLLALAGVLDFFVRLCRRPRMEFLAMLLIPGIWAVLSGVAPWAAGILLLQFINEVWRGPSQFWQMVTVALAGYLLAIAGGWLFVSRWRKACREYYFFN